MIRAALAVLALLAAGGAQAQEADAVAPGGRQVRPPEAVPPPASGPDTLPPDSLEGPGPTGRELDALTARVSSRLRCPVCRSQSVLESSASLAEEMQREIRRRLAAGQPPEDVEAYFVSRYGEWILLQPEPRGLNLLVYLLPAAALLAGGLLVWNRLRAWTGGGGARPASGETDVAADDADGRTAKRGDEGAPDAGAEGRAPGRPGPPGELSAEEEERIDALVRRRERGGRAG